MKTLQADVSMIGITSGSPIKALIFGGLMTLLAGCGGSGGTSLEPDSAPLLADESVDNTVVRIVTTSGDITVELNDPEAPLTVENFLNYVDSGHYDNTIFHRVIEDFMIQGGGYTEDYVLKSTNDPVANEADNGLLNVPYTIAMARTTDPQSARAQFFINVVDNPFLDYREPTISGWGYTVFGRVTSGTSVVDQIVSSSTGAGGPFSENVPVQPIVIKEISRIGSDRNRLPAQE